MKTRNTFRFVTQFTMQGLRQHQEDRYYRRTLDTIRYKGHLLALMDGHGGKRAAEICAQKIRLSFKLKMPEEAEQALRALVCTLDSATKDLCAGTTLSVACVLKKEDRVSIAVLGDSPVIVIDAEDRVHVSPEHNCRTNLEERQAAEKRGGVWLESDGGFITNGVDTGSQLSRALGNKDMGVIISKIPAVYTIHKPRWIALMSDGVLDSEHKNSLSPLEKIVQLARQNADARVLKNWLEQSPPNDNATALVWRAKA